MVTIVGVQFQKNGKIYNYETGSFDLRPGDYIICDTSHGPDLGQVVIGSRQIDTQESGIQLKKVIRAATEKDLQISSENRNKERTADPLNGRRRCVFLFNDQKARFQKNHE